MNWAFSFFTGSNRFIPMLNKSGVTSFYSLFVVGDDNLLRILAGDIIVPVAAGIAFALLAFSLYKSIVSDKVSEAPWKTVFRSGAAMLLVFSSITVFGVMLNTASEIQLFAEKHILASYSSEELEEEVDYEKIQEMADETFTEMEEGTSEKERNVVVIIISLFMAVILT